MIPAETTTGSRLLTTPVKNGRLRDSCRWPLPQNIELAALAQQMGDAEIIEMFTKAAEEQKDKWQPVNSISLRYNHLSVKISETFDPGRFCTSHSLKKAIISVSPLVTAS